MSEDKKSFIERQIQKAGLTMEKVIMGTYETEREGKIGVFFQYRFSDRFAYALIQLAMQDREVYEGLKDLSKNLQLIIASVEGSSQIRDDSLH